MANAFRGEKKITIQDIDYTMVVDMGVISEFESETGKDFFHLSVRAINAYTRSMQCDSFFDKAEILTGTVSLIDATWLFYLAAKKGDSYVEFGEIQEAMAMTFTIDDDSLFYPALFVSLVEFAIIGKKKEL